MENTHTMIRINASNRIKKVIEVYKVEFTIGLCRNEFVIIYFFLVVYFDNNEELASLPAYIASINCKVLSFVIY